MSNKRKIIDIETKCRFCLGDEGYMSYLFDEILLNKVENITKCTSIVIKENEDLPDKICHICMYKLDTWNEFKEQFIKSNEILLAHLESDESVDLISETNNPKRKHDDSQASGAENLSESVLTKKSKHDEILLTEQPESVEDDYVDEDFTLKDEIPEEEEEEESKDLNEKENPVEQEEQEISESIVTVKREGKDKNNEIESKSEGFNVQKKPTLIPMRFRHLVARRGKTTARRKASTKRWVARKRALLAATGGYGSDTDSIISDNDSKLSPVQKARAKTNADKEVDKQKKLARALKNLQTDMKGEYGFKYDSDTIIVPHSDSEANNKHQTRSQKKLIVDKASTNETKSNSIEEENIMNETEEMINEKENNCISKESENNECDTNSSNNFASVNTQDENNKSLMEIESSLNPQPIKSEIKIGDAIYIVTSTLVPSESHYLNKTDPRNTSRDINGAVNSVDDNSQERNTDIIDAVQLRRINPRSIEDEEEKRIVERCLNIEVEGTELEALQKVQAELANFVENDMKDKLWSKDLPPDIETVQNKPKDSFQSLDQQLKSIVETAIRKNIESSLKPKKISANKIRTYRNQKVSTYSPAFVKAAMKSKMFQPRVLLTRLDLGKVRKRYKINNISSIEYPKSNDEDMEDRNRVSNEMQTDSQLEYPTFNINDSDSDDTSDDEIVTSTPRVYKRNSKLMSEASKTNKLLIKKLSGPKGRKKLSLSEKVLYAIRKGLVKDLAVRRIEQPICESVECDTTTKTLLPLQQSVSEKVSTKKVKFSKNVENQRNESEESNPPKYTCNICNKVFPSFEEKDEHSKSHISQVTSVASDVTSKAKKPRMMRCKRCHEVVDARLVRVHTCRSTKFHKCYVCNATFRSEKSLISHLETHDESEFNIESIERGGQSIETEKLTNVTSTKEIISQRAADSNTITATTTTTTTTTTTRTDEYFEKKEEKTLLAKKEYICFVCDKKFTDEEILKDHLQEHCNDVSEDDASSDKEQYQCAICGDTLETEDALENHVEKHLCDDEDDNPNLINISNDSDRDIAEREIERETGRKEIFKCSQCFKEFDSDILLALHIQVHEEELEIEEWQKESTEGNVGTEEEFFCAICEEAFENEGELSHHLDVHNSNSHVCFLCEQPFLSLEELQIHVSSH